MMVNLYSSAIPGAPVGLILNIVKSQLFKRHLVCSDYSFVD